jgi:hypothetical protein
VRNYTLVSGTTLLSIVFFVAKITGYINWSWWLVFAPLWAGTAIFFLFIVAAAVFMAFSFGVLMLIEWFNSRRRWRRR